MIKDRSSNRVRLVSKTSKFKRDSFILSRTLTGPYLILTYDLDETITGCIISEIFRATINARELIRDRSLSNNDG